MAQVVHSICARNPKVATSETDKTDITTTTATTTTSTTSLRPPPRPPPLLLLYRVMLNCGVFFRTSLQFRRVPDGLPKKNLCGLLVRIFVTGWMPFSLANQQCQGTERMTKLKTEPKKDGKYDNYLRQGGYVFIGVCLFVGILVVRPTQKLLVGGELYYPKCV